MDVVESFFKSLHENGTLKQSALNALPYRATVCARVLVRDKALPMLSDRELNKMLHEEGLMPAAHYGIPRWYRKKYRLA